MPASRLAVSCRAIPVHRTVLRRAACVLLLAASACASVPRASIASRAQAGAFNSGRYRNLFAESGHSANEVHRKLDAAFAQLFHGDSATETVFYWTGTNANGRLAYLSDINNHDVRSEGMSYGMMIAVQMDKKAEFDALWNWARTNMHYASGPRAGYFRWQCMPQGCARDSVPASDGEEYF